MMLRQGWARATSPHGASQTIFKPGISGVPDERAIASIEGPSARARAESITAQIAIRRKRKGMYGTMPGASRRDQAASLPTVTSGVAAQRLPGNGFRFGHKRR